MTKSGYSAAQRRRARALEHEEYQETLFGPVAAGKKRKKEDVLKVHPNDPASVLLWTDATRLHYATSKPGAATPAWVPTKSLVRQQNWKPD